MTVKSESDLIAHIQDRLRAPVRGVLRLGMGDDAAILRPTHGYELLVSCDSFLEGVHFLTGKHTAEAIGWKALARATSDIAAMGGVPRSFLLGLALPESRTGRWLEGFLKGTRRAARRFGMVLAGGDTSRHRQVLIHITVIGEAAAGKAVLRSGARPGDLICVSGRLGEAQLGLELLLCRWGRQRRRAPLLTKHLYPQPRLSLGQWLAAERLASAMIDTSDGLSTDLGHICASSGVGARVFAEKIPAVSVPEDLRKRAFNPLELALHGGEDYELVFTVPRRKARRLPSKHRGLPISIIGEITREKKIVLTGCGRPTVPLLSRGWDPFRRR